MTYLILTNHRVDRYALNIRIKDTLHYLLISTNLNQIFFETPVEDANLASQTETSHRKQKTSINRIKSSLHNCFISLFPLIQ